MTTAPSFLKGISYAAVMGTACNSLQPPHRTPKGESEARHKELEHARCERGGSGSGGRRSGARPGPGAAPAATSHTQPAAPAGNLLPSASYCGPTANPPPALTAAPSTAQFLHKSQGEGEREAAAEGRRERGNFRG